CRSGDARILEALRQLDHRDSRLAVTAERAMLRILEGSCTVPIAALGRISANELRLQGLISDLEGNRIIEHAIAGDLSDPAELGTQLGEALLDRGAAELLASMRNGA